MGAEASSFQDLELEDELPVTGEHGWTLHDGLTTDDIRVSVFLHDKSAANVELVHRAAKHLKTLRHPSVLKFLALTKSPQGLMLVTEHVTPLEIAMENLSSAEIAAGIYNIIEALVFLHDRGGMCHNNICSSSIYVSDDGGWRLGGMEHLCLFSEATNDYLKNCRPMRSEAAIAPEEQENSQKSSDCGHAGDAFAFGSLVDQLMESLRELGDMTKTFELRIQDEFLHPDPNQRPKLHTLLNDKLFRNEFLEIMNFLSHITVKSEAEKSAFFKTVTQKLFQLPTSLVATRLARPLLSRFVLLDGTAENCLIPHLLTPCTDKVRGEYREGEVNPLLPTSQFRQHIIPELFKIFHVRDAHIRLVLLSRFSEYCLLFDKTTLQKVILPQVLQGLRDRNDNLVRVSLLALADLVPILGGDIIIGTHRLKLFSEGKPKFSPGGCQNGPIHGQHYITENSNHDGDQVIKQAKVDKVEKRTLKDIAKEREREKRREEAKQRNEERRKKREERIRNQQNMIKAEDTVSETSDLTSVTSDSVTISEVSREITDNHNTATQKEEADWSDWEANELVDNEDAIDKEIEDELNSMESTLPLDKANMSPVHEASVELVPVSLDWANADHVINKKMARVTDKGHGALVLKTKTKPTVSPLKKGKSEGEWADHGDWGFNEPQHGSPQRGISPLTEGSPVRSKVSSRVPDMTSNSQSDEWGTDWDEVVVPSEEKPSTKSPDRKSRGKLGSKLQLKPAKSKPDVANSSHEKTTRPLDPSQSNQDLGAEFEIHSIKLKKKSKVDAESMDFFSDMEPVLNVTNPLARLIERAAEMEPKQSSSNYTHASKYIREQSSLTISMTAPANMDAVDWGDDGWGDADDILAEDDLDT